jgi:predicted TIM-barrel fold metal-dependent hydrolase
MLPSDFFRRNVFASFQQDPNALRLLDVLGRDTPTWGSDYPHTESTFPRSREVVGRLVARLPADAAVRIAATNCERLYGFDVPALAPAP